MVKKYTIKQIPANRNLIEKLYLHGKINQEGREYALKMLYPDQQWGLWISRILLHIGSTLIISSVIYFFAFNWAKITPMAKLYSIESAIVICVVGAYLRSLQDITGQILLLFGTILVGVFIAVFGQIYQTGANAYQVFMAWSLLTLGWTFISNFSVQWIFWIIITNIFYILLWWQKEIEYIIFTYISIFNGSILILREYFLAKKLYNWLSARWIRVFLNFLTLLSTIPPIIKFIYNPDFTGSIVLSMLTCLIVHGLAYFFYRFKLPDIYSLSATIFSSCIFIEIVIFRIILIKHNLYPSILLLMGITTISVFAIAITYLRQTAKNMGDI